MKDSRDQDTPVGVSLATLVRHVSEASRKEMATLRAAIEQQITAAEARLEATNHQPAINATLNILSRTTGEHIDHAREQVETTVTQVLAANTMLRTALDNATQQLEASQAAIAKAEADRKTFASQQREALNERSKLAAALDKAQAQLRDAQAQLKQSQIEADDLSTECAELQRQIKDAVAARGTAETQYQQLVIASQKLTDGLSQTLRQDREQIRAIAATLPPRSGAPESKAPAQAAPSKAAPTKSAPPASPAPAATTGPRKKPLQFSGKARDAKRVKIRRGINISVDGSLGELVDLSVGGAQAVLRQLVKPNQLVQLILPTIEGQITCRGRIAWVLYERSGTSLSVYRTGMKFSDVNVAAIETFMADFGEESPMKSRPMSGIA
jgi:PilZ domain